MALGCALIALPSAPLIVGIGWLFIHGPISLRIAMGLFALWMALGAFFGSGRAYPIIRKGREIIERVRRWLNASF